MNDDSVLTPPPSLTLIVLFLQTPETRVLGCSATRFQHLEKGCDWCVGATSLRFVFMRFL